MVLRILRTVALLANGIAKERSRLFTESLDVLICTYKCLVLGHTPTSDGQAATMVEKDGEI
jgi:hypothetical protein